LRSGWLLAGGELLSWDGVVRPSPFGGGVVLDGRFLVTWDRDGVRVVDTESSSEQTYALSPAVRLEQVSSMFEAFNARATSVAFPQWNRRDVLIVAEGLAPSLVDVGWDQRSGAWLDDDHLLLVGDRAHCVFDVRSGERSLLPRLPRSAWPRLAVTGRFDPDQLRASLRPPWKGPISPSERERRLGEEADRIEAAARDAGLADPAFADRVRAIRLRSCPAPRNVRLGASRLGGRPDLPRGVGWPRWRDVPMAFVAQLRTDELAAAHPDRVFAEDTLVSVFVAIDPDSTFPEDVHVEVVATQGVRRLPWPPDLVEELRFAPALAVVEPALAVPNKPAVERRAGVGSVERFLDAIAVPGPQHRMFGHPSTIQAQEPPSGYELLLQLDSDAITGMSFGDGGRFHIWMPRGHPLDRGVVGACVVELDSY
jgi:Domain of unknown function (DUF1963)